RARAGGRVDQTRLERLAEGVTVAGVRYGPIEARLERPRTGAERTSSAPANLWITLALAEGKNREARKVLEALGLMVNRLIRVGYGPFALGDLAAGAVEEVGPGIVRRELAAFIDPRNLPRADGPGLRGAGSRSPPPRPPGPRRPRRPSPSSRSSPGPGRGPRPGAGPGRSG
ncbi:MAG: pseudouridine synthase family protein, partial [Caulobacteraceae bacterium]